MKNKQKNELANKLIDQLVNDDKVNEKEVSKVFSTAYRMARDRYNKDE